MNIAIIGTGNIGSGLARTFSATSHDVIVAGASLEDAQGLARTLKESQSRDVRATDLSTAVAEAEVVFLAVPYGAVAEISASADFAGKVVVDVTNPIKDDFSGLKLGFDTSAAEEIARLMPGAKVVKGFNTVFAQIYAEGLSFAGRKVPVFLASDDTAAKVLVSRIATDAGFDPVDAGGLTNARYIEPMAYLNIQFGYMLGKGTQIAPAWLAR